MRLGDDLDKAAEVRFTLPTGPFERIGETTVPVEAPKKPVEAPKKDG